MLINVTTDDDALRFSTEDEGDVKALTMLISDWVLDKRLAPLAQIRAQLWERVSSVGRYEYLSEGEWDIFALVNEALHPLVAQQVAAIVDGADDGALKALFPHFKDYKKTDWAELLKEGGPVDEDRIFRDFFPPNLDEESEDSDEDDLASKSRASRTAKAQDLRRSKKKRPGTFRQHKLDPDAVTLKKRMNAVSDDFGKALGQDVAQFKTVKAKPSLKPLEGPERLAEVLEAVAKKKEDFRALRDRRRELQEWALAAYRKELAEGKWTQKKPESVDALIPLLEAQFASDPRLTELNDLKGSVAKATTKAGGYLTPFKELFNSVRGKFSYGTAPKQAANARIFHPEGTTAKVAETLRAVNENIANGEAISSDLFVIAQYRGISYDIDKFSAVSRRRSRESVELRLPVYSSAVFDIVGISPGDYYAGRFAGNREINERLAFEAIRLKEALLAKRKGGKITFSAKVRDVFRSWSPSGMAPPASKDPYKGKLNKSETGPLEYDNAALALQNFYTINYAGFFGLLRHYLSQTAIAIAAEQNTGKKASALPKPDDLSEDDDAAFRELFGGLPSGGNPFASSGKTPRHALRYAYGVKSYTGASEKLKLRPEWTPVGRPLHPYGGKIYVSLHPVTDFGPDGPLDVVALAAQKAIDVPDDILGEREAAFPALIPGKRICIEHIARYPSLTGSYKTAYLQKYGLTKSEWEAYQTLVGLAPTDTARDKVLEAMSEWLVRYHEARLIELARRVAEADGKILVYRGDDGQLSLGDEVTAETAVEAIRGASADDSATTTLGGSLGFDLDDRDLLDVADDVVKAAVPVVGIPNGGNDCYISATMQLIRALDPEGRYEHVVEGRPRDNPETATAVVDFRTALLNDAANGTYVGVWPWAYTRRPLSPLRTRICAAKGWLPYRQQDAYEALQYFLGALDHSPPIQENFTSDQLRDMLNFPDLRPSNLHVRRRVTRTFDLSGGGVARLDPAGGLLNADNQLINHDLVNLIELYFPPQADIEAQAEIELEPLTYEALRARYDDLAYDVEHSDRAAVWKEGIYYAAAPLANERVEILDASTDQIFVLKRFNAGRKIHRRVAMPAVIGGRALKAVVRHHGGKAGGHYVAYICVDDVWFQVNDDYVTRYEAIPTDALRQGYIFYYRGA